MVAIFAGDVPALHATLADDSLHLGSGGPDDSIAENIADRNS